MRAWTRCASRISCVLHVCACVQQRQELTLTLEPYPYVPQAPLQPQIMCASVGSADVSNGAR